jgi:hypothetical protein
MRWWKSLAINIVFWSSLLVVWGLWGGAVFHLTRLVEKIWCQFDPLGRDLPEFCVGVLGPAEETISTVIGTVLLFGGILTGSLLLERWSTWRERKRSSRGWPEP